MTIYNKVIERTHEIFTEIQKTENIKNRDFSLTLEFKLIEAQEQLAQIIEEIIEYQKSLPVPIIEIASSGGQYIMNGIPLIFTLFQYENEKDNKYYLKVDVETTVDKEFYGEEYQKTIDLCKKLNQYPYCSYDVEELNKIMSHYTHDFVDFEHNEDDKEWHGNIC